ncbi:MAG: flagellin [Thermogemmata sp.]|nr:flagellin [Thermogemmata sp.]
MIQHSTILKHITSGVYAMQYHNSLLYRYYNDIATGIKLRRPSDNPIRYLQLADVIMSLSSQQALNDSLQDARRSIEYSINQLININNILNKVYSLSSQSLDATLSDADLVSFAYEINTLLQRSVELCNSKYNGRYIFSGELIDKIPFVMNYDSNGYINNVTYQGSLNNCNVALGNTYPVPYTLSGQMVVKVDNITIFDVLITLRNFYNNPTGNRHDTIVAAMSNIERLRQNLDRVIGSMSAYSSQLEDYGQQVQQDILNKQTLQSDLQSTDYAEAVVHANAHEYLLQASMAVTSRLFKYSLLDYIV